MTSDNLEAPKTWRQRWLVVNVFAAIPFFGSPFKKDTFAGLMHDFGECAASLSGGTAAMMKISLVEETDPMEVQFMKHMLVMAMGMGAGKISYNVLCSGGALLYQYAMSTSTVKTKEVATSTELRPLTATQPTIDI